MKLARLETFLIGRPWNNLLFVRLETDTGITGVGEGTMQWQAQTVAAVTELMFKRYVVGASPFDIERLVQAMYRNEYARGGPVLNSAIAAIEMALWDICAKHVGQPLYNLLGGRVHDTIPAYANGWYENGCTPEVAAAAARKVVAEGYSGMKFDPFWLAGADPQPEVLRLGFDTIAAVRDAVGPDARIMIDGHGRFSVGTANQIAHVLGELGVYWFEEPVAPENFAMLGEVDRPKGLRIAAGERCWSRHQVPQLIAQGRPHVLQPDIIQVGGILEAKKIAAIADAHGIPVSFHCPFGPVATAAALHLDMATTNIVSQESFSAFDVPWRSDLVTNCPMPRQGAYRVSDAPGLGIELNEDAIREHPFREEAVQDMWADNGSMSAWRG
ncbi:mandelate racemase/muconate lactonizing enzyme family protein [Arsenicitalea aurantiaca]|uniref:Mandelate racemase/muconate lactonizing enzyme family protein n=1 Tax=Arsenicitalea aurantiaca TaxID=1783274 RepID=A0A433X477_9HYPH|nr:mandelate racemase/muconate lactonizing enzyme family protein [Arsenicitalea aurantiaca]RUT28869.1 mandelate racemase/muconate lactonizing enzyme family protein [Arsenicitalea aurantiaca]